MEYKHGDWERWVLHLHAPAMPAHNASCLADPSQLLPLEFQHSVTATRHLRREKLIGT